MAMNKEILDRLHRVENKYGSIANAPYTDPDLVAMQKYYNKTPKPPAEFGPNIIDFKIKELIEAGYRAYEIYDKLNVGKQIVYDAKEFFGLNYKPIFRYKLTREDCPDFYTTYIRGMCTYTGVHQGYSKTVQAEVENYGYEISDIEFHWCDLPENSLYVVRNSRVKVKHGIDSYLKEDWKH